MLTPPTVNCVFAGGAGEQPLPPPNVVQPPPTVNPPFLSFAVMRPVQNPAEIGEPTHAFVAVAGLVVSCAPVDVKVVVLEELNVAPTVNAVLAEGTEVAGEARVLQPVGAQPPATVNPPVLLFAVMVPLHAPATTGEPTHALATVAGLVVSLADVVVNAVLEDEANTGPVASSPLPEMFSPPPPVPCSKK